MPLAYLADPWQKMKVHEESEVILRANKSAVNFEFSISILAYVQGSKLTRINLIFPLS